MIANEEKIKPKLINTTYDRDGKKILQMKIKNVKIV